MEKKREKKNNDPPKKADEVRKGAMEELMKAGGIVDNKAALLGKFNSILEHNRGLPFLLPGWPLKVRQRNPSHIQTCSTKWL